MPTVASGVLSTGLAALAASRTWGTGAGQPSVANPVTQGTTGSEVDPAALALCLVSLAAWGAVLVLGRRGRRTVSLLGAAACAAAALSVPLTPSALAHLDVTVWPAVTAVASGVAVLPFLVVWRRAPGWPEMSRRYDAPSSAGAGPRDTTDPGELWKALDEGQDPTA